jgi:hypothetical protein
LHPKQKGGTVAHKVILTFHLKEGMADAEIKRSEKPESFPNLLAQQPGCMDIALVKVDESTTMAIQTWEKQIDWWNALKTVQELRANSEGGDTDTILVSRDFKAGDVKRVIPVGGG